MAADKLSANMGGAFLLCSTLKIHFCQFTTLKTLCLKKKSVLLVNALLIETVHALLLHT